MSLVNELIKGLLPEEEKKKVVAVYGGGFKPPTSGHFKVVKQALKENPEIDKFIILIGGKPRNGITPDESILIWDIYKTYLPFKVEVKYTSVPPIKGIYNYAKEHPDEEVLFVIGAREGNEEDFKDIASRTTSLDKYPNLNLRTIVTAGGVSGTAARNASKISLEKFKNFVPSELSDEEVEEVYNIVANKIQENITESKQVGTLYHYTSAEGLKGILQSNSIKASEEYYLGNDLYFVSFTRNKNFHKKDSAFDVSMDYRIALDGNKLSNKYKITPFAYIPGWNYKDNWEYDWLDDEPESVVRDFLNATGDYDEQEERISFKKPGSSITNIKDYILKIDKVSELTEGRKKKKDPKKGTGKKPKGSGRRLYTDEDPKDTVGIKFSTRQDIVDTLNKKSFKAKSHARQSQIINLIHQRVRAAYGRAKDPAVKKRLKTALDYITKRKEASKKKTQRLKKQKTNESVDFVSLEKILDDMFEDLGIDINFTRHFKERVIERGLTEEDIIELMKKIYDTHGDEVADLGKDENRVFTHLRRLVDIAAINKGYGEDYLKDLVLKTAYKRNSLREPEFRTNRSSPKLRVNENASYSKEINIKEKIAQLTQHMIDKGMNIEPLPTLEFIDGDSENASDFFGKTAYYDPNRQHIVLYTEGRHPKDIVRSYAHEMIHHIQYLEDRLGDVSTTNTMEDDHLDKIEQEANLRGTMTFRNWTDSLQEGKKKDPFGLNAYAMELARGLEEQESEYKVYLDMDGVLADFDQRFRDISGMEPREFENKYGKKAFWDLIDEENKVKFWVGIPTMPGAADLVDAVKEYNYELLTSPSAKKQSYLGKILWVKNHIGDVFSSKPRINFKKAKEKHLVKPQLAKTDILIDDREDTIGRWNTAGGTGIVYKSIGQVLNDLKKLGL